MTGGRRRLRRVCVAALCGVLMTAAAGGTATEALAEDEVTVYEASDAAAEKSSHMEQVNAALTVQEMDDAYRTTYEIFVYSFADGNGDGVGDLRGIREKLDYIGGAADASGAAKQTGTGVVTSASGLGCTEIWLTQIFPSPTYHKYDATDYCAIAPQFGTMEDFDELLADCHKRGIRLILDLALNHTSSEHPWFTQAADYLRALPEDAEPSVEECPYVSYYNFSREREEGYEPLLSDTGEETGFYYEARFWSGMPDLNLDSEAVRGEIRAIADFWFSRGVDGFRLDATTYYYTGQTAKNIEFLTWLRETVREINADAYLVGEAWTDQSSYAELYDSGIDSLFDFAFAGESGRIAGVVRGTVSARSYGDALVSGEALYAEHNPDFINAPFYTNHDLARSTGYYAYDDGSRTKLAQALNLLMPGNAFLYYGEELGMKGSGKDENKRAPMYWTDPAEEADEATDADDAQTEQSAEAEQSLAEGAQTEQSAEAEYLCDGPPDMDRVEMKFGSCAEQREDPYSVWNYVRNVIRIRNSFPAIARGKTTLIEELSGDDICAMSRGEGDDRVVLLINTSEERQEIDLRQLVESLSADADTDAESGETQMDPETDLTLAAVLEVSEEEITISEDVISLAPFGVAVLQ